MDWTLVATALLMAAAGLPHCAAMCGAACTAAVGGGGRASQLSFHAMRIAGYAVAGAVVASSVGLLAELGHATAAVRPLWSLVHAAAFVLGLWLLWQGRQPAWLEQLGRRRAAAPAAGRTGWQTVRGPLRSGMLGSAWVAWPCGLLQSALVVAALASHPAVGAAVMVAFGVVSAAGVAFGPWVLLRLAGPKMAARSARWTARLAGAALAAASGWALYRGATGDAFCLPS